MTNQNLYILISTIDDRILNLKNILQNSQSSIMYIVSHQVNQNLSHEVNNYTKDLIQREDVRYAPLEGKGVAKNRNNTLNFIEHSSICLILDDDVLLCDNTFETVVKSFDENPSAEFISFKILDLEGNDSKPYPKQKSWHTLRTLTGIGTTEIAFRSDMILDNNIRFDLHFGPGSDRYPIGEDFIFAMDLYKMNIRMLFIPIPIVHHPDESTGKRLDKKIIFGRGAMFARVYGWKSFIINFLFSVKKYFSYKKEMSFLGYLFLLTKGTFDYFTFAKRQKL